jgi:hypothetical protein
MIFQKYINNRSQTILPGFSNVLYCAYCGLLLCASTLQAQTDTIPAVSVDAKIDLVSRYLFRGMDLGKGPSVQPNLAANWKGFSIGSWGSYTLTGQGDLETDLFISKTVGFVTLAVWDFWIFNDTDGFNFFDYQDKTTGHTLEANVLLSGGETLPFNFMAAYVFYGADPSRSLYLELQYVPKLSLADLTVFAGYQAKGTLYAANPGFVNLGCTVKKAIELTDRLSFPLSLSLIVNPAVKSAWLVAGITF